MARCVLWTILRWVGKLCLFPEILVVAVVLPPERAFGTKENHQVRAVLIRYSVTD